MNTFLEICLSFGINFVVIFLIVRFIYFPQRRDKEYVFTFFAFSTITFFVLSLLSSVDLSVGFGFGLFAIFSVLRYRTHTIPIREMTYLFVIIALPVVNSILFNERDFAELVAANLATVIVLYVIEKGWGFRYEIRKSVTYEKIDMIRPENWPLLIEDLHERTGLAIKRIEIGKLNFLRDTAEITMYYDADTARPDQVTIVKNGEASDEDYMLEL